MRLSESSIGCWQARITANAGDEVEGASDETIVATGFCRNGPSNDDNMGSDKEKYRIDQLDDVISTTSAVFLGLTLGCARCHDHKYDPLPTEDYYRFLSIFNSTEKYGGVEHIKESQKTKDAKTASLALIETSAKVRPTFVLRRGNLNSQMHGPGIKPRLRAELIDASQRNKWPEIKTENPTHWRRSVYIYVKRQLLLPMMELFDSPTTTDSCSVRAISIVPTQALIMMNDEFIEDQAAYLARRSGSQSNADLDQVIELAHRLTLSRPPLASHLSRALRFVEQQVQTYRADGMKSEVARHKALSDLCHVLLNSSEFVFVE